MKNYCCILMAFLAIAVPVAAQEEQAPRIESIGIQGNEEISDDRLKQVMLLRESSLFKTVRFDEDIFLGDLDGIIQFYHRNGYLQAAISDTLVHRLPENRVEIEITIDEGVMTVVDSIGFTGNNRIPAADLREAISLEPGDPYRRTDIETATSRILRHYADNGYLESEVDTRTAVDDSTHTASIVFEIAERQGFRIDNIRIEGLVKTNRHVVMREITFETGDMVNYSRLLNTQRELYLTGLFRSVYVRPVPPVTTVVDSTGASNRDILIDVEENMSGEFNVSVGYDTIERLRSRIELYNNNLRGTALKAGASASWSTIQNRLESSLTEPRLFDTRWQTDLNFYQEFRREPGYNTHLTGGRTILGRRFGKNTRLNFIYRFDSTEYTLIKLTDPPDRSTNTSSLQATYIFDTRNNLFNTSRGLYFELTNEFGGFFRGNARTFARWTAILKYFYPASNVLVWGSSIELGIIDSEEGLSRIPLNERFYAGGPSSLRGFAYRKVGPIDDREKPVGGKLKLVWNVLEARRNIWRWLNGAMFYDIGNVWKNSDDFDIKDIRQGAGVGLRISTPLGLARIDYGFKLDKRGGEDRTEIHFSMGQAF